MTITRPRNEDKDEKKARKAAAKEEKQVSWKGGSMESFSYSRDLTNVMRIFPLLTSISGSSSSEVQHESSLRRGEETSQSI